MKRINDHTGFLETESELLTGTHGSRSTLSLK
jgi:hypothetical protein